MENKNPYSKKTVQKIQEEAEKEVKQTVKQYIKRNEKQLKKLAVITFVIIYGIFSLIITLNEHFWKNKAIPTWSDLFVSAGLSDGAFKGALGDVAVHFIDVEQGDCALIIAGETSILIDGGEVSESGSVIKYLNSLDIDRLDIIVASHPHSDHIGSLSSVLDEFGADKLIMPKVADDMEPITSSYMNMIESAEKCNAKIEYAKVGKTQSFSDGSALEIIAPVKDYEDYNNYSIVCKFVYKNTAFLFTGDIEKLAEKDIVESGADLSADVIKIAHHGSKTSSLKIFIQAVAPKYAAISVGAPNDYGHPHDETLKILKLLDIKVYRTDRHGSIVMFSDGNNIEIVKEKEVVY